MSRASRRLREGHGITSAHPKWWTALPRVDLCFVPPGSIPLGSGPTSGRLPATLSTPAQPPPEIDRPRPRNETVSALRPSSTTDAAFRNGLSAPLPPPRDTLRHARHVYRTAARAHTFTTRRSALSAFLLAAVGRPQRRGWTRGARQRRQDPRREHSREGGPHTPRHLAISRRMQPLVMAVRPTPSQ